MHTVWKGSISFGLVNIPIRMFTATEDRDIRFRQLHAECHTPIRYSKHCPTCDREIGTDEIIKGFEYEKGNFVIITAEDLEKIAPDTRRAIEILDFVNLAEIDPIYFDKSYFLSPQETGEKAYSLLRAALEKTKKIAIARITIRNKESLAAVRIYEHGMVLETIFYPDEVRDVSLVPALPAQDIALVETELDMAVQLITNMSQPFDPTKYKDEYREDLQQLIQKKLEGKEIATAPSAPRTNVLDLMQALKESLAQAGAPTAPPDSQVPTPTSAALTPVSSETPGTKKQERKIELVETYAARKQVAAKEMHNNDALATLLQGTTPDTPATTKTVKKKKKKETKQ
ncbi:non-homologous end joining protein Ku [Brevibacillus daliensis]|uniref:non-homologous end joining protein Ku n=1 Tax=Brevibacillus daliensis TaxID=2892995 RepID=UPI001E3EF523|nr:Ku protein [Brevibacillus daliensis]